MRSSTTPTRWGRNPGSKSQKVGFLQSDFFYTKLYRNIAIYKYKMGITKTQIFDTTQNELAVLFKVLGHPARIAILQYIGGQNACICNDIVEEIGLAQPTISQHLKELKRIGIIEGEIEGNKVCYCIAQDRWKEIQSVLNNFFNEAGIHCC